MEVTSDSPGTAACGLAFTPARPQAASAPPADRGSDALRLLMVVALYAIPVVVALRPVADPVIDPDVWWHLRVGQWVVEHRTVPSTDLFSAYGLDKPWVAYSWLFEVGLFGLHAALGLVGIVVYRVALAVAVVAALHRLVRRREPRFLVATGLTAAAALAVAPLFSERPWLFTILFTTLTLDVILDLRANRPTWLAWVLPIIYVLWANLHIQFVYGLFLLALACVAPLVDGFLARRWTGFGGPAFSWRLAGLAVLCVLATLVNPYHGRLYLVVAEYATQPGPFRFVNELQAPEFREPSDWVMLGLAAAAVFVLGKRRRLSSFEILLLASTAFFAFRARRDMWFVVLAALAVLVGDRRAACGLASPSPGRDVNAKPQAAPFVLGPRRLALVVAMLAGLTALLAWQRDLSARHLQEKVAGVFPVEAASVVAERGYPGPLYNDFNWGGYLIWALPRLPVSVDGRTNLHGDERMVRFGDTWAGGAGWRQDPDLAAAGVIIAPADSPLASLLGSDDRFTLVHQGPVARVFVRQPMRNR